jgi:putative membrane protein
MSAIAAASRQSVPSLSGWFGYGAILVVGGILYVLSTYFPAEMPFWMPWQFSWAEYLVTALSLAWFVRGLRRLPRAEHPAIWRSVCFFLGTASLYIVLQTHIDYFAQHMFFVHRAQHFVLHHAGAFLVGLSMSGPVIWAGMPDFLKPVIGSRAVRGTYDFMQHPAVAPVMFVGMIYLWLVPAIHTRVMLDWRLYDLMNATMAIDGIFFWCLILDGRPKPPARIGSGLRALLVVAVEPFQMILGAVLSLSMIDYYPVYKICGRIWDITAISDQHYGGLIIWLPSTLTSFAGVICVLMAMRINDEKAEREGVD